MYTYYNGDDDYIYKEILEKMLADPHNMFIPIFRNKRKSVQP